MPNNKNLEKILQDINKRAVKISEKSELRNNAILKEVLDSIVPLLKEDPLFNKMYTECFYGGSYYDGLKIKDPDEYDLDLLFQLPKIAKPKLEIVHNNPGFVELKLKDMNRFRKQPEWHSYKKLDNMLQNDYLDVDEVNKWFTGILQKALNKFPDFGDRKYKVINFSYSGPARTLNITGPNFIVNVDLVPCFVLENNNWPAGAYRRNTTQDNFFIVPKCPINEHSCWRLSFQKQERATIWNKSFIKPALRLLKTLRDKENDSQIKSYFLKTIVLLDLEANNQIYDRNTLSSTFMHMLEIYQKHISAKRIPYYWNKNLNLLDGIDNVTLKNIQNRLSNIIKRLNSEPPYAYALFVQVYYNQLSAFHRGRIVGLAEAGVSVDQIARRVHRRVSLVRWCLRKSEERETSNNRRINYNM